MIHETSGSIGRRSGCEQQGAAHGMFWERQAEQLCRTQYAAYLHEEEDDLARDVAADAVDVHVALASDPVHGTKALGGVGC